MLVLIITYYLGITLAHSDGCISIIQKIFAGNTADIECPGVKTFDDSQWLRQIGGHFITYSLGQEINSNLGPEIIGRVSVKYKGNLSMIILTLARVTTKDSGRYTCVNTKGNISFIHFDLEVIEVPKIAVSGNGNVLFCNLTNAGLSTTDVKYTWNFMPFTGETIRFTKDSFTSVLHINDTEYGLPKSGVYMCSTRLRSNNCSNTYFVRNATYLQKKGPPQCMRKTQTIFILSSDTNVSLQASFMSVPNYESLTWIKSQIPIIKKRRKYDFELKQQNISILVFGSKMEVQGLCAQLIIRNVDSSDLDEYTLRIRNNNGVEDCDFTITVLHSGFNKLYYIIGVFVFCVLSFIAPLFVCQFLRRQKLKSNASLNIDHQQVEIPTETHAYDIIDERDLESFETLNMTRVQVYKQESANNKSVCSVEADYHNNDQQAVLNAGYLEVVAADYDETSTTSDNINMI